MTCVITPNDLSRLRIRPKPPMGEVFQPLVSVDPKHPSNAHRLSISDYWTDITTSKIKSDISFFLNGEKGAGKSYCNITLGYGCACHLAEKLGGQWHDYFNIDFIAIMLPDQTSDLLRMNAKYIVKDFDDVSPGYNSRSFATRENREQNDIIITNRTDNNIQLWSAPDQGMTDKVLRETCNFYGEAERNPVAINSGFNVLRIFRVDKNKRTGDRYYPQIWHNNCKLVKCLLKSDYPELKALFEEYDVKRAKAAAEMKVRKEERKKEEEKAKLGGGERKEADSTKKARERAWKAGEEFNSYYLKGMTQKEILKMIKVPVNTWKYWVGTFINEDGTKIPVET